MTDEQTHTALTNKAHIFWQVKNYHNEISQSINNQNFLNRRVKKNFFLIRGLKE